MDPQASLAWFAKSVGDFFAAEAKQNPLAGCSYEKPELRISDRAIAAEDGSLKFCMLFKMAVFPLA
jgi:hypothetical protein